MRTTEKVSVLLTLQVASLSLLGLVLFSFFPPGGWESNADEFFYMCQVVFFCSPEGLHLCSWSWSRYFQLGALQGQPMPHCLSLQACILCPTSQGSGPLPACISWCSLTVEASHAESQLGAALCISLESHPAKAGGVRCSTRESAEYVNLISPEVLREMTSASCSPSLPLLSTRIELPMPFDQLLGCRSWRPVYYPPATDTEHAVSPLPSWVLLEVPLYPHVSGCSLVTPVSAFLWHCPVFG